MGSKKFIIQFKIWFQLSQILKDRHLQKPHINNILKIFIWQMLHWQESRENLNTCRQQFWDIKDEGPQAVVEPLEAKTFKVSLLKTSQSWVRGSRFLV